MQTEHDNDPIGYWIEDSDLFERMSRLREGRVSGIPCDA